MSIHHRPCAFPDCRFGAQYGRSTCAHHRGHPDGRILNHQYRKRAPDHADPPGYRESDSAEMTIPPADAKSLGSHCTVHVTPVATAFRHPYPDCLTA